MSDSDSLAVKVEDLSVLFGSFAAVDHISFEVEPV